MIDRCFIHCGGVGPRTAEKLNMLGFQSWEDCLSNPGGLPFNENRRERFISALNESKRALEKSDIHYLVSKYPIKEQWRILGRYFSKATFFDIETTGLSLYYNHPSVIAVYHRGELLNFFYGKNLDDFLDIVEDSELLVSFNGNSFDVPFLERYFNLPCIGVPHIDLRWVAYHMGHRGGLKKIERDLHIIRPSAVSEVDGFEAVSLFYKWQDGDKCAGEKLVRYCRTDAASSYLAAASILNKAGIHTGAISQEKMFMLAMDYKM